MTITLTTRADINLDSVFRVAWQRDRVEISGQALQRIADCRASFMRLIDSDPAADHLRRDHRHGRIGQPAARTKRARTPCAASRRSPPPPRSAIPSRTASSGRSCWRGSPISSRETPRPRRAWRLPSPRCWTASRCPPCRSSGQGGAGEILALYPLFAELTSRFELEVKERGSLINGSPCAAALVADAALAARRRVRLVEKVFALSIEAFRAPLEHYDAALDALWGDEHEAAALRGLRAFLVGAGGGRRNYQAPVSYRIVPRILGHAHRALATAERAATVSLALDLGQSGLHPA